MIAICKPLYGQVRANPAHSSELVSQLLKGEWVQVLKQEDHWSQIKTEYGYTGWTRTGQLRQVPDDQIGLLRESTLHLDLAAGSFQIDEKASEQLGIETFLAGSPRTDLTRPNTIWDPVGFSQIASTFSDVPYVWGGKTPSGLDCSGLVQLSMNLSGFSFPRDAWQQAKIGDELSFDTDKPNFDAGDLLYFQNPGKPIHHVAISLGKDLYLHASEWVRVNSLDPDSPLFTPERKQTLVTARKIKEAHLEPLMQSFKRLLNYTV